MVFKTFNNLFTTNKSLCLLCVLIVIVFLSTMSSCSCMGNMEYFSSMDELLKDRKYKLKQLKSKYAKKNKKVPVMELLQFGKDTTDLKKQFKKNGQHSSSFMPSGLDGTGLDEDLEDILLNNVGEGGLTTDLVKKLKAVEPVVDNSGKMTPLSFAGGKGETASSSFYGGADTITDMEDTEGFSNMGIAYIPSSHMKDTNTDEMRTKLNYFNDYVTYSPEACLLGSNLSTSTGCANFTQEDVNFLRNRGNNNYPFNF